MIDESEVGTWLRDWFAVRAAGAGLATLAPDANVFEAGVIDSLGVLELISSMEARFGVRFDETHLQDPRFVTIDGLADIVSGLRAATQP